MRGLVTHPAMFLFHPLHLVGLGHGADCNQKTLYRVQGAVRIIVVEGLSVVGPIVSDVPDFIDQIFASVTKVGVKCVIPATQHIAQQGRCIGMDYPASFGSDERTQSGGKDIERIVDYVAVVDWLRRHFQHLATQGKELCDTGYFFMDGRLSPAGG
ncbi:MAG: hypothetical protein OXH30_12210 [Chloroflexi bacterium]|nr:hypothetical protein [Chloroflexota bacterium]